MNIVSRWDASIVLKSAEGSANLRGANLLGAYLREADLLGAYLREADLRGADLREADLREANLRRANLINANLRGADLRGADLREADLSEANLIGADLSGTNLRGADLREADLSEANLSDATLESTILPGFENKVPKSLKEAAIHTKEWLSEGHWIAGSWIKTPTGAYAGDCLACLHGAARYVGGPEFGSVLSDRLIQLGYTVQWNDDEGRTVEEVCAALDHVAKEATV